MNLRKSAAILMSGVVMCGVTAYLPQYGSILYNTGISAIAANLEPNDDYPQKYKNLARDEVVDEWNFFNRECTSFVAWCLNSRNGVAFTNQYGGVSRWGNATTWGTVAQGLGITVDMNPAPGSVWWSSAGHVAWVREVNGNNCTIEEYNWDGDGLYHIRERPISSATGYIHIKDLEQRQIGPEMTEGAGQTIPDGDYWINSSLSSSIYIDPAPGSDIPAASGANVATWDYGTSTPPASDAWTIKYLNNGFYSITQMGTEMSLDVTGAEKYAETNLQLYPLWGDDNTAQQWSIAKTDKGYTIQSKCNSFFVDSKGGVPEASNIWLYQGNGGYAQAFNFIPCVDKSFKGSGTAASPYQISSADDLRMLSSLMSSDSTAAYYGSKYYEQTVDIDLENEPFTPIGCYYAENKGNGFTGHYNGKYHSIKNMTISRKFNYNGLFGWLYDGAVIENLSVYGEVNCPGNHHVGGITGEISNSTVKNCSFNGSVSADSAAGGISGSVYRGGIIENCYFNGTVEATKETEKCGGFVGYAVIGNENGDFSFTMKNSYAVTHNEVNGGNIGLLKVDGSLKASTIENNFYLKTTSSKGINGDISKGCAGLTEELMKTSATELLGDPFVENTSSGDELINDGYPLFSWQAPVYKFKGDGTDESPYLITSKKELEIFRDITNDELHYSDIKGKSFLLTTDIDLADEKWTPIASRTLNGTDKYMHFDGHFDGGNHTIKGLNVNEKDQHTGFFGSISNGSIIENLAIEGKVVCSTRCTGGIVGEIASKSIVRNCSFIGDVTGADEAVGGIVGYLWQSGTVQNCYHIGTVTCPDHSCGGIVGKAANETTKDIALIENCYHTGKLVGTSGSIIGFVTEKADSGYYVAVRNCFGLTSDGKLCGTGETKEFDAMQCTVSILQKSASLIGDAFTTNPDSTYINGYPIFVWQDKTNIKNKVVYGDANLDGNVSVADAVAIMQFLGNKDKYNLSAEAKANADCYNTGDGITGNDALTIQQIDAKLLTVEDLPVKSK